MSLVVAFSLITSALVAGLGLWLFRRWRWLGPSLGALVFAAQLAWYLHPVCRAITPEDLALFDPPIETRQETGMIGQKLFQQREGQWFQCKSWTARAFYF